MKKASPLQKAKQWFAIAVVFGLVASVGVYVNRVGLFINVSIGVYAAAYVMAALIWIREIDHEQAGCQIVANDLRRRSEDELLRVTARDDDYLLMKAFVAVRDAAANGKRLSVSSYLLPWKVRFDSQVQSLSMATGVLPMLGFLGTVVGLMQAVQAMAGSVESAGDIEQIKTGLQATLSGMWLCFSSTLMGSIGALVLKPLVRILDKGSRELLADIESFLSTLRFKK